MKEVLGEKQNKGDDDDNGDWKKMRDRGIFTPAEKKASTDERDALLLKPSMQFNEHGVMIDLTRLMSCLVSVFFLSM